MKPFDPVERLRALPDLTKPVAKTTGSHTHVTYAEALYAGRRPAPWQEQAHDLVGSIREHLNELHDAGQPPLANIPDAGQPPLANIPGAPRVIVDDRMPPGVVRISSHPVVVDRADLEHDQPDAVSIVRNEVAMLIDQRLAFDIERPLLDRLFNATPAERAAWAAEHEAREADRAARLREQHADDWARLDLTVAAIALIEDPVLRAVLELHAPLIPSDYPHYVTCDGCDRGDGYDVEDPTWPCTTIVTAFEAAGHDDLLPTTRDGIPLRSRPLRDTP